MRSDTVLATELAICDRYKIPHSFSLGGPHRWTDLDRVKAVAFAAEKAAYCSGGCGTRPDEWDEEQGGSRFAYVAETRRCPGCELIAMEQDAIPEHAKGIHVFLTPNPDLSADGDEEG